MKKNHLILNQKEFLSFTNYKKLNNQKKKFEGDFKVNIYPNSPLSNGKEQKNISKYLNNVHMLSRHNYFKYFCNNNKSLLFLSSKKIIPKIKLSNKIYNSLNEKFANYQIIKNKETKTKNEQPNEIFNNKKCLKFFENINKYRLNCSVFNKNSNYLNENKRDNDKESVKISQSQKNCISSRKINKEYFGNGIYKLIKERRGRKKIKFKIIGTLKTEPNFV